MPININLECVCHVCGSSRVKRIDADQIGIMYSARAEVIPQGWNVAIVNGDVDLVCDVCAKEAKG